MPKWRAKVNGQEQVIEADTPEQAARIARFRMVPAPDRSQMGPSELLARSRERAAENPEIASTGPLGFAAAVSLPFAATPAALGIAKDAAIYGGAELAEKALGLPSWVGESIGLVNPAKQGLMRLVKGGLGKALARGGEREAASVAAGKAATKAAGAAPTKIVQPKAVDPAKAAYDAEVRALRLERERLRTEMIRRKAGVPAPEAAPAPPSAVPPAGPRAVPEMEAESPLAAQLRASLQPKPVPGSDAQIQNLVRQIQMVESSPGGKATIREWLASQPPEIAAQVKAVLARRQGGTKLANVY